MVYLDENKAICRVLDQHPSTTQKKLSFLVNPTLTAKEFIEQVSTQYSYNDFCLVLESSNINLNEHLNEKLFDIGIDLKKKNNLSLNPRGAYIETKSHSRGSIDGKKTKIIGESKEAYNHINKSMPKLDHNQPKMIVNDNEMTEKQQNVNQDIAIETEISSDDDLALGASASPTEQISSSNSPPALPALFDTPSTKMSSSLYDKPSSSNSGFRKCNEFSSSKSPFVGLVNQAMTCYLNSLLQALYMTPEFRNALYNWEFDGSGENKSIPFQLQKLFVNLQTSNKLAVETTDLTKSFGWDSTEAWQQHDIQELCRVMFDALEQKFKNTKQADLINNLYEGKMIDYVKCLECETEKSREDTFLDIPLPVRPFGSTVAYESVEEALKAFVQPETLDGNNQYFCEKCNKKCDAHKGLKFKKFPYILTLHLKRFDFDYQTLHRIKLNDKVTFPQQLNLNGFVENKGNSSMDQTAASSSAPSSLVVNTKPNLEIASIGSVESAVKSDDCSTTDSVLDEDASQYNQNLLSHNGISNEPQDDDEGIDMSVNGDCKSLMSNSTSIDSSSNTGPFFYELFAIMIHSGSASGGHYYAYIRDFESGNWYSFNDQTVSSITQEDIARSFGGSGAFKSYYSGFSSSTNAYMLMYRQLDPARNTLAIKEENFPLHIKNLVEKIKNHEEDDRRKRERESEMLKLKIYFKNPITRVKTDAKIFAISDSSLKEVLEDAYSRLKIKSVAPIERCRLVAYDNPSDSIERSFEEMEDERIGDIMYKLQNRLELLMEIRDENKEFEVYHTGGITVKVFNICFDGESFDVDGPFEVRAYEQQPISEFKSAIISKIELDKSKIMIATKRYGEKPTILSDDVSVRNQCIYGGTKVFIASSDTDEIKFKSAVDEIDNILTLYFALPNSKKETLEKLSIPSYEPTASSSLTSSGADTVDSVAFNMPCSSDCNSEDSSLSDSDRTLVDDSNVSAIQMMPSLKSSHYSLESNEESAYFFKATLLKNSNTKGTGSSGSIDSGNENDDETDATSESQKILKVLADRRMSVNKLKLKLQPYVKIPMEYFKIFHVLAAQTENECTQLNASLNSSFKDEERLVIELGRALRKGEFKVKLYYLNVDEMIDIEKLPFICDYILRESAEVGQTKREILAHIRGLDRKYEKLTFEKTRLRKKSWKSPAQIYMDDQKFGDDIIITVSASPDIIIQELPNEDANLKDFDGEPLNDESKSLFVRQFHPSKMEFGKWNEIMIGKFSELKGILSKISGIMEENIMYTKLTRSFVNTSIMQIEGLQWFDQPATMEDNHTLSGTPDGSVYLYKDKTEPIKQLTTEERMEISKKENTITSTTSTYSPRRERGLKIYLDSPKKQDS